MGKSKPRYVWYDAQKWKLVETFRPTQYDTYLLLSTESETTVHEDGVIPVEMLLIDTGNDVFQYDCPKVRAAYATLKRVKEAQLEEIKELEGLLSDTWLKDAGR
jgi:hypothetical protein